MALQITELEQCPTEARLNNQIRNLPKGLTETYEQMLSKIDNKDDRTDVKTFLRWLIFSIRPMTLAELADTVAVDFSKTEPQYSALRRYQDPRKVLEKCSGLITELEGTI